jgi:hypothetical protein
MDELEMNKLKERKNHLVLWTDASRGWMNLGILNPSSP